MKLTWKAAGLLGGLALVGIVGLGLFLPTLVATDEDAQAKRGYEIVSVYCTDCHAVGKTGESPLAPAPAFRDLHKRYDVELLSEALVEGLVTAHPAMPEFEFDPDQAEAIITYLHTLETAEVAR